MMRRWGAIGIALLLASAGVWAEPVFRTENIFPLVSKHVHGSSIVECPNGDLLACWFHGSGERSADDVVVNGARLKKGAREWSPIFLMADTPGFPDCNPVLFIDANERLFLFWIAVLANRWECCQLKYRIAEDYQGAGPPEWSWQDIVQLKPGEAFAAALRQGFEELAIGEGMWAEYAPPYERLLTEAAKDPYKRQTGWMTRIHPYVLPGGRILLPLYSDGFNVSLTAISDDQGATWRASGPMVGAGPIQPTLLRRKDGTVVAYLRDSGDAPPRVQVSMSSDNGETWALTKDIEIPNPGSSLEAIALKDGRWLMIANDTPLGRHRLTALLSVDEGRTWSSKRQVEPSDDAGKSFGYPSVIQARDGLVHMTYSYGTDAGKSIRHAVVSPDWLPASE